MKKGKSCQINSWQVWAQRKITIISWHDTISMPVLPISDAVHCNRPRSALHPSSQCTASVLAVHCIRSRKYLHPFPQVLATIPASTCNRPCKYLQENTPSFRNLPHAFSTDPKFLLPRFFLLTRTSAMFYRAEPKKAVSYITTKQPRLRFRMGLNQRPHD